MAAVSATLLGAGSPALAQQSRVLGIDVSAYQGNLSATAWATLKRATNVQVGGVYGDARDFVLIRSSRGGTTGEDHRQGGYNSPTNTFYNLSERYDDPYYVQNITLATSAGLFAGTYHFARPDVVASTLNSDGVTTAGVDNTGTDEANHMIQMASPWMRPGYLLPTLDLEAGNPPRTATQLATFCTDFSAQIYAVMGIRPMIYIGGAYSSFLQGSSSPAALVTAFPKLWNARYVVNDNATNMTYLTGHPKDTYSGFYGPWDDPPNPANPWSFWQYGTHTGLNAYSAAIDKDVAQGGLEFVKDNLVPAIWMNDSSGLWTNLLNWNSGQTPVPPVPGTNQLTATATNLPTPCLPTTNDTVILDRPNASITVTLDSGAQNIRKLYMREALNITGGSLTINYIPSWDSTTNGAQFSGPVTLSGGASLSVHTLQVDAARTFTLNGGSLTFNTLSLMPGATPAKLAIGGDVNFNPLTNATATITNGAGSGSSGSIDLGGGTRVFTVTNGVNLFASVPIANGALAKTGLGTMRFGTANTYSGGTTISAGTLEGAVSSSIPGNVTNSAGTLKLDSASTLASGAILALAGSPGTSAVNLSFSGTQTISALYFGTTRKAAGTWAASGAAHTNAAFAGAGILNVTAGPASSTVVSLTSGSSPSIYGDSLNFTATVTGNAPSGTVQFKVDGVAVGSPVTLVGGSASLVLSTLSVSASPHQITAYYSGDDNNNLSDSSASPLAQIITARSTSCLLTSSGNPSVPGTNVTFTAAVNGVPPAAGLPTGNVVFSANGTPFATNALVGGSISASTTSLPPGTNAMTAQYVGDGSFLASTGSVDQLVKSLVTCSQTNALLSIADHLDGTFTLTFLGTPQADYFVLASPDVAAPMTNWAPVVGSTNTVTNISGVWRFTVTNTTPQQFYRSTAVAPCP
jgi:autotransporter-associated beta strand protein